jgi:hypothetical protein
MLVAAQAVANNANLLFGRILLPRPPADVADKPFGWRGGGSGFLLVAAIRELLARGFGKPCLHQIPLVGNCRDRLSKWRM